MYVLYKLIFNAIVLAHVSSEECRSLPSDGEVGGTLDPSFVYQHLSPAGYSQCIRECRRYMECRSVLYDRNTLTCTLLRRNTTSEILLQTTIMENLGACSGVVCTAGSVCVTLTQGGYSCVVTDPWCPKYIGERCYTLSENVATWDLAKLGCEANGFSLARVDTADLLTTLASGLSKESRVFVGGEDMTTEGQWLWTDENIPINFTGIPHFLNYNREHQDCLMIKVDDTPQLQDTNCPNEFLYICQSPTIN